MNISDVFPRDTLISRPQIGKTRTTSFLTQGVLGGLPISTYTHLLAAFSLTAHEATNIFHIPTRTLARRKKARRLGPDESDRVFRFARIATRASDVLGSEDKARRWLHRPNRALGNMLPLNLLATDAGIEQIETVLGRLEHGVYS